MTVMETLSHKFIEALSVPRDRLYAKALVNSTSVAAAETALQRAAGSVFQEFAKDVFLDVPSAMEQALGNAPPPGDAPDSAPAAASVMPADVWARLAAAVQLEASRSDHAQALHPDSDLLKPDPILAPKKGRPRAEPPDFDVSSPGRLFMFVGAAVFVGLALTVYIMTRPSNRPPSATSPAPASAPASAATRMAPLDGPATTTREAP
jgi:hypothetical protein